jgi:hypothetical protein
MAGCGVIAGGWHSSFFNTAAVLQVAVFLRWLSSSPRVDGICSWCSLVCATCHWQYHPVPLVSGVGPAAALLLLLPAAAALPTAHGRCGGGGGGCAGPPVSGLDHLPWPGAGK